ncbi:MAG: GNAT family N-acetyltransferase [Phycisphaerae bacterium]|nr:GNAT family N-acetyltransferase [Phycisphaerae bacterium]
MPIRIGDGEDLPEIHRLLKGLSRSIGFEHHESLDILRDQFCRMKSLPEVYSAYVYAIEDKIVAFASLIHCSCVLHRKGTALINELIVDEAHRGRGIGSELLKHCRRAAEKMGYDQIEVGVEKANLRAIHFYRKNGLDKEYLLLGREFEKKIKGTSAGHTATKNEEALK